MLEGETFNEMLAQPHLQTSHPAEVSHVVIHLLGEFHLLRKKLLSVSHRGVGLPGRNQGVPVHQVVVHVPLRKNDCLHTALVLPHLSWDGSYMFWKREAAAAVVLHFQEVLGALLLLLGRLLEKASTYFPEPHCGGGNRCQREVGLGGPQMRGD